MNFRQITKAPGDHPHTRIKTISWPFNRDDVIAEVIMLACQDERNNCVTDDDGPAYISADGIVPFHDDWQAELALLEGYAQAWLNRWESNNPYDCQWIWDEMCDRLKAIGTGLWD